MVIQSKTVLQVALNVVGKPDALATWDGLIDMAEQEILKEDCSLQAGTPLLSSDSFDLNIFVSWLLKIITVKGILVSFADDSSCNAQSCFLFKYYQSKI